MIVIVFRSRLRPGLREEYVALVGPSGSVCVQQGTPAARFNDRADKPGKRRYRREADRDYYDR